MNYLAGLKRTGCYLALGTLTVSVALAIAAVTPRKWGNAENSQSDFTVYISGDGMHTNLFVPVQTPAFDWRRQLDLAKIGKGSNADYRYLQFGWGDRVFYMETPSWETMSIGSALRALFWQNPSALFVKGHAAVPKPMNETVKCVHLSRSDYLKLMEFITASFQTKGGHEVRLGSGQDGDSSFYAANGSYSILKTCNSWTADALRIANVNTPVWAGLAPAVMRQLDPGFDCQP